MTKHLSFKKSLGKRRQKRKKKVRLNSKRNEPNKYKNATRSHAKSNESFSPKKLINSQLKELDKKNYYFPYPENEEENNLYFSFVPLADFTAVQNIETNDPFIENNRIY